jgi:hypothetical protein
MGSKHAEQSVSNQRSSVTVAAFPGESELKLTTLGAGAG